MVSSKKIDDEVYRKYSRPGYRPRERYGDGRGGGGWRDTKEVSTWWYRASNVVGSSGAGSVRQAWAPVSIWQGIFVGAWLSPFSNPSRFHLSYWFPLFLPPVPFRISSSGSRLASPRSLLSCRFSRDVSGQRRPIAARVELWNETEQENDRVRRRREGCGCGWQRGEEGETDAGRITLPWTLDNEQPLDDDDDDDDADDVVGRC